MKTYHPKSWSQQARGLADRLYEQIKDELTTEERVIDFLHWSYRNQIIRYRAAKRFGRKIRGI